MGTVLKKTVNLDGLKLFVQPIVKETTKSIADPSRNDNCKAVMIQQYVQEILESGQLQDLINFTSELKFSKISNVFQLNKLFSSCPIQSFIKEVSKDEEEAMEVFASQLLPEIRHMSIDLTTKTTMTMILSSVCVMASSLRLPVMSIAQTLKERPNHLEDIGNNVVENDLDTEERISVGGETIEWVDVETLDQGKWLNDKIINSFMGLIKTHNNTSTDNNHVFVLPSYTAVLWNAGNLDHWMFKKIQFAIFKHIFMPVNVDDAHWILMVVNVRDRTINILDSMPGQSHGKWIKLWRQFMSKRDSRQDVTENLGDWTYVPVHSSKQLDGSSCGIFTLMNAECITKGVPIQVMRQVHCPMYRDYVRYRLLQSRTRKHSSVCDLPECQVKSGIKRMVQCCVCGKWLHTKCAGIPTKAAIEDDYECCFCLAMYK